MPALYFDSRTAEIVDVTENEGSLHPSAEAVLPLAQLLVAKEFPFKYGDFPHTPVHDWDEQHTVRVGKLIVTELAGLDEPANFTRDVVTRLNILSVFPPRSYFDEHKHFGGFSEFKKLLGIDPRKAVSSSQLYDVLRDIPVEDFAQLLIENYNQMVELPDGDSFEGPLKRWMIKEMNQCGLSPSAEYIRRHYGGVVILNEVLGFPDISAWDRLDYIQFGAAVLRHNGPGSITSANLRILSRNGLGPDQKSISTRFGPGEFIELATEELERQQALETERTEAIMQYYSDYLPPERQDDPFVDKAKHRALFLLARHYAPHTLPELPDKLRPNSVQAVVNHIIDRHPDVTLADIETVAITLDVFDDLWPSDPPHVRHPIIATCKQANQARQYAHRRLY